MSRVGLDGDFPQILWQRGDLDPAGLLEESCDNDADLSGTVKATANGGVMVHGWLHLGEKRY